MNPKIALEKLKEMTYDEYQKSLKKEIKRALLEVRTDFIMFSDFVFKDSSEVYTALIFGKFTGRLQKFYKQQIKERANEKDFARGSAYFEEKGDGTTTIHLNMEAGKAKASKIKKNGKKMFNRLGLDIHLQELELQFDSDEEDLIENKEEKIIINGDELVEHKDMHHIHKDYLNYFVQVSESIIPKIKSNAYISKTDFEQTKQLYILTEAYIQEYDALSPKIRAKYTTTLEKVLANAEYVKKIYAKVKQMAMAQNDIINDKNEIIDEILYKNITDNINDLFVDANNIAKFYSQVEAAIFEENQYPLEPTNLNNLIDEMTYQIQILQSKASKTRFLSQEKKIQLQNIISPLETKLIIVKEQSSAFEKARIESKIIINEFNKTWNSIGELFKICQRIIIDKKAIKQLYSYERLILIELCESFEIMINDLDSKPSYVINRLKNKRIEIVNNSEKIKAFIAQCKIVTHPSGKEAYFDSYAKIDQSKPISTWIETVENLNKWMLEQEVLAQSFEKTVEIEIKHINQMNFYTAKDFPEELKGKTKEETAKFLKNKNSTACYRTAEWMIKESMAAQGKKYAVGKTTDTTFLSIYKEDKSKATSIVQDSSKSYESLSNDALVASGNTNEAYQYILNNLNLNNPILVGVDHTYNRDLSSKTSSINEGKGYNSDKTSDHFIVIYGKGLENQVPYLLYMDPGSSQGNSKDNKLYPIWKENHLYWYDPISPLKNSYVITSIAKSIYE